MDLYLSEPYMQIRHNSLLFYSLPTDPTGYVRHKLDYKTYSGKVTGHAQKRIMHCVDLLLQLSPPRLITNEVSGRPEMHTLSFITLTIPANEKHLTASEGHKLLLAPWLLMMKRKANMTTYLWKAEFQKNGQLHYHITTPSWIHYSIIKNNWNNLLSKKGMLQNWFSRFPDKMPNSTDVHKVYKMDNIGAYLRKYLSKSDQNIETKGKIWDCSQNLKSNKNFSIPIDGSFWYLWNHPAMLLYDRCSVLPVKNPTQILKPSVREAYAVFLDSIKN
jgi:hypothetical protein